MTENKEKCDRMMKDAFSNLDNAFRTCRGDKNIVISGVPTIVPGEVVANTRANLGDRIPRKEAIEAIAQSKWAQDWAEGMGKFVLGHPPDQGQKSRLATELATKVYEA